MDFNLVNLAKKKQLLGAIVAAGILAAIFVPFQTAEAVSFSVIDLGGTSHTTSVTNFPFTIRLVVGPAEAVVIEEIDLFIDGSMVAAFDIEGNQLHGTPNGVVTIGDPDVPPGVVSVSPYSYSYSYSITSGPGYNGPVTVNIPAFVNPSLLSPGSHTFQSLIFTGASTISSAVVSFSVTGTSATLNINAENLSNASIADMAVELRKGLTLVETKSTPAKFTVQAGQTYTVYPTDFGNNFFDHWKEDGSTTRGHTVNLSSGGSQTLTAVYKNVPSPVTLSITSKLNTGTAITGLFNKVTVGSSTTNIVSTGFTPNSYLLEPNTAYTVFASDFGQFVFDHWETSGGSTLPSSVNLRGTAVNIPSGTLNLVAVYKISNVATVAVSQPTITFNNVAIPGLPGSSAVTIQVNGAQGTGNLVMHTVTPSSLPSSVITTSGGTSTLTSGGTTFTIPGVVLEIDTTTLQLSSGGSITVTVPFALPSGVSATSANVKVFHFNGVSWVDVTVPGSLVVGSPSNTGTIQFQLTGSASPIAVGFSLPSAPAPSGGGSSGGGSGGSSSGGARGPVVLGSQVTTYPESYFAENPLLRFQIASSAFLNAQGLSIAQAKINQQFSVKADFTNYQQTNQTYAFIVQVVHPQGYVQELRWQEGTLASGQSTDISVSVMLPDEGVYKTQIFILDGLGKSPRILSEPAVKNIQVTRSTTHR